MAFNGYLIRIGAYDNFFDQFIQYQSYKASRKVQDIDSYRDTNGVLHRNVLEHESLVVEFTVRPLNNLQMESFYNAIRSNFTVQKERRLQLTCYMPELNDYITEDVYMPDPDFQIKKLEGPLVFYEPLQIKFIGY